MDLAIAVDSLVYEYANRRVLHELSFSILPGTVTALVGPNGAGKTTLLRCLAALENPYSGSVRLFGLDSQEQPRECHGVIGYLSDFYGLYDDLTIARSLAHIGMMHGMNGAVLNRRIESVLESLDLSERRYQPVRELSRGLRQRVAIAQAILHGPRVLLLDEPASGLDPEAREDLSLLVKGLASRGMTIIVSSHILAELQDYSTDILILADGKISGHQSLTTFSEVATRELRIVIAGDTEICRTVLGKLDNVELIGEAQGEFTLRLKGDEQIQRELLALLVKSEVQVTEFHRIRPNLQDLYTSHMRGTRV